MSADVCSWKTAICHASVSRRAIVLRMFVSGTRSTSPAGTGACNSLLLAGAAAGAPASARSTSSATIRPSGPVPRSAARSIPRSRASRRASGEALIRPFPEAAAAGTCSSFACNRQLLGASATAGGGAAPQPPARLALLADERNRLADRHLALGDRDLEEDSGRLLRLLCVTLSVSSSKSGSPFLHRLALRLEPADDRAGLHALAEPRQDHLRRHRLRLSPPFA